MPCRATVGVYLVGHTTRTRPRFPVGVSSLSEGITLSIFRARCSQRRIRGTTMVWVYDQVS